MKKTIIKIGALLLATALFIGAPVCVLADSSYTYNYDYWGEYQEVPDAYEVANVVTSAELGLEVDIKNPSGIYAHDGLLYLIDTGNNRILEIRRASVEKLEVLRIIDSFNSSVEGMVTTFSGITDMCISEEGNWFIADTSNNRILKLDSDLNYLMEFVKPDDTTLDSQLVFQPTKVVVDTAERVYCIANGINKGMIKYENDGVFSGFVGATPVVYNLWDYFRKKFASQEQLAQMVSFVPTEYDNLYMDKEGFIYAVEGNIAEEELKGEEKNPVRKLNLMGTDILVRNGWYPIYGDLYMGSGGGYVGGSSFEDITVFDNDVYICMDANRGRMFAYDDQGNLMFAFGGNGNSDGYFRKPSGIEHIDYDLFVVDSLECSITIFVPTEFGRLLYTAIDEFDVGHYDASGAAWQRIMDMDGNYDLAYIGIGRSLLRQKKYKESMDYFKLKYDAENYSKAFKQYRKIWVEENIGIIVVIVVLLFAIPLIIGKIKSLKFEIDHADIFQI